MFFKVVVVDEIDSLSDIEALQRLQRQGISVIVGTNVANLQSLMGHPLFAGLLPSGTGGANNIDPSAYENQQLNALLRSGSGKNLRKKIEHFRNKSGGSDLLSQNGYKDMPGLSRNMVILELDYDATKLKLIKNVPSAIEAIQKQLLPKMKMEKLQWSHYNESQSLTHIFFLFF